jgi:hypothetical protein
MEKLVSRNFLGQDTHELFCAKGDSSKKNCFLKKLLYTSCKCMRVLERKMEKLVSRNFLGQDTHELFCAKGDSSKKIVF